MIGGKSALPPASIAWIVAAGIWFWLVSFLVPWAIAPFFGSSSRSLAENLVSFLPYSSAPLLVGMLAWWLGFHRRTPLLASGASVGFVVSLAMWPAFFVGYFLFAFLIPAVFVVAGFVLELVYLSVQRYRARRIPERA